MGKAGTKDRSIGERQRLCGVVPLIGDDLMKRLFVCKHYLLISSHAQAGDEGETIAINLDNMQSFLLDGRKVVSVDSDTTISVEGDYYKEDGLVWETGTFDLKTIEYTNDSSDEAETPLVSGNLQI